MESKLGRLNFCVALFGIIGVVVYLYTNLMSLFQVGEFTETAEKISLIVICVCNLVAVASLLWVIVTAIIDTSKGKKINQNLPFYGFAIFGVSILVKTLVVMQTMNSWAVASMWFEVILGLVVLGSALFAVLFGGKARDVMGFVISAILVGVFAFRATGFLTAPASFEQVFACLVLATLFIFTALIYAKQLTKPADETIVESEKTVKKIEKK